MNIRELELRALETAKLPNSLQALPVRMDFPNERGETISMRYRPVDIDDSGRLPRITIESTHRFLDKITFYGDKDKGLEGLFNHPSSKVIDMIRYESGQDLADALLDICENSGINQEWLGMVIGPRTYMNLKSEYIGDNLTAYDFLSTKLPYLMYSIWNQADDEDCIILHSRHPEDMVVALVKPGTFENAQPINGVEHRAYTIKTAGVKFYKQNMVQINLV